MFIVIPIVMLAVEVFVFIAVAHAIGWLAAILLLLATSVLGVRLLRIQGRAAIERVSLAVVERRTPGRAAIDGALGSLGCVLLIVPGFVTDLLGGLLLLPAGRRLVRGLILRRYTARLMGFLAAAGRFSTRARTAPPADVESTAVEDDLDRLGR